MKRFKVEYQRGPGSPINLAGISDEVHVKFGESDQKYPDGEDTDLMIIGFSEGRPSVTNDFFVTVHNAPKGKVIITAQAGE